MNTGVSQPVGSSIPDKLRPQLEGLGLAVISIDPAGRASAVLGGRGPESVVLRAPAFAAAVRPHWAALQQRTAVPIEVWPGLWLAPLPFSKRPRRADAQPGATFAAFLAEPRFLDSEQWRVCCDAARVDLRAATAAISPASLVSAPEIKRTAALLAWVLQNAGEEQRRTEEIQNLSAQLSESYEELSLLYKFSTSTNVNQPPSQFLTEACIDLQQTSGLRWIALQLIEDDPRLNDLAGQVFTAGPVGCDATLLRRIGKLLMQRQSDAAQPMIIDDTKTIGIPCLDRIAGHLLVVSLLHKDKPLGILFGGDKIDGTAISSVDSKLCNSLANSLAIVLENMMLYDDMAAMFMGVLRALTSSIDAKDRYTRGHSERVALLSRQLATSVGIDAASVDRLYISGLVHDLGKIGVPESVLCKTGKLTDDEFAIIKMHPLIGARILQDIRQMRDIIPGVMYHHERWDGKGYPEGLAGDAIPIFGRLICLADSFDAMSSNRTYRQSLTHDHVLAEIRRCSGTQFDPQLAQRFVELDFTPFFQMSQKHKVDDAAPGFVDLRSISSGRRQETQA